MPVGSTELFGFLDSSAFVKTGAGDSILALVVNQILFLRQGNKSFPGILW